jgi:5-carboxymethyl-2-hydroxymuconate isomerase
MRLISIAANSHHEAAVVEGDRVVRVGAIVGGHPTIEGLAADLDTINALRAGISTTTAWQPIHSVLPAPALLRPSKIVAVGRNYPDHADEEGADRPAVPLLFAKFPSTIIRDGDEIRWDAGLTTQVDYEAELAVVIGRRCRNIAEDEALDRVFGYTCLNDVSARDLQFADGQWTRGKSLDTFCPVGPVVVTADEIADPQRLAIRCEVNGRTVQAANTSEMLFPIARLLAFCSAAFTLEPGDIVATGTPAGVGVFRDPPTFLGDGDVVTVDIESVGRLTNPCRESRAA